MDTGRTSRMNVLVERLRSIDKSISRLTAERLKVLAEIAKLDAEDGASERQTASRVARITSSTPKQAAGEVAMAKQVAALPGIAEAHANGEISNNQLGAVAAIASASSEDEALELAKKGTSAQLHRRAAASRGKLFEERRKPEEDGQSTRIHGRLPFAESKHLETQLRKIADRLGLCDKERPSPSARMADALLILTKHNPSQALHDHEEQTPKQTVGQTSERTAGHPDEQAAKPTAGQNGERRTHQTGRDTGRANADTDTPAGSSSRNSAARPKLYAVVSQTVRTTRPVIDYDEDPFPEVDANTAPIEPYEEDTADEDFAVEDTAEESSVPQVVVQRADTRVIIHWNAQSGEVNYENGPPIDHPRLLALLCDAQIDLQHCDPNGLPTGLITTQHHSTWRQDRYLAFRDGPCRVPECEGIGKTQAHHIFEDRIDRVTSVKHMINVCNRCHQEHHDGTFAITGNPEKTVTFTYKDGTTLTSTARPLPNKLKQPKPTPFSNHQQESDGPSLFATSA
jgi:chorismate mutase